MVMFCSGVLLLISFIDSTSSQFRTPSPSASCICETYTALNATWINADKGCIFCQGICIDNSCECLSESVCGELQTQGTIRRYATLAVILINVVLCFICIGAFTFCMDAGVCGERMSSHKDKLDLNDDANSESMPDGRETQEGEQFL